MHRTCTCTMHVQTKATQCIAYVPIVIFNEAKINILQDKIKYVSLVHFGCADDAAAVDDDVSVAVAASTFRMQCTIVLPHIFGECTLHSVP